jgi:hypothetical protein
MERDPKVLAGFDAESKDKDDMGQGSFFLSPEIIISQSLTLAIGPLQTKIFNNLCEKDDLDAWNDMQADPDYIIRNEKSLTPPAKSNITIEPYKVTYNKVDPDKFDMALLVNIVKGTFEVSMFAPIFKSERFMNFTKLIFEATPDSIAVMSQHLFKLFDKYPIQLILKQYPLFLEKVDEIINELEKNNVASETEASKSTPKKKAKGKKKNDVSKTAEKQPDKGV